MRGSLQVAVLLSCFAAGFGIGLASPRSGSDAAGVGRTAEVFWPPEASGLLASGGSGVTLGSAVELLAQELSGRGVRSPAMESALLVARSRLGKSSSAVLDAAESTLRVPGDVAADCNRVVLFEWLGLSYQAKAFAGRCPALRPADRVFACDRWAGRRISENELSPAEQALVEGPVVVTSLKGEGPSILARAPAWRVFFEREAISTWIERAGDPAKRDHWERQVSAWADRYARATGNPAPSDLWRQLRGVPEAEVSEISAGLSHWLTGSRWVSNYEPEKAIVELGNARTLLRGRAPAILPLIDVGLAATRFHVGDNAGLWDQAQRLARSSDLPRHPWVRARASFLWTAAGVGRADWESVLETSEIARAQLRALGEQGLAAYLDLYRSIAWTALEQPGEADESLMRAVRSLVAANDTRLASGAQTLFARQLGRRGRPLLAVEYQREALRHDLADGQPAAIADSRIVLAEQLGFAGNQRAARAAIVAARRACAAVPSEGSRRRVTALLNEVEAELDVADRPELAEARFSDFLRTFEAVGDHYRRAETLLARARVRLRLRKVNEAHDDLVAALGEIGAQSASVQDGDSAAALLGGAREALEALVELSLGTGQDGQAAFRLAAELRRLQVDLATGTEGSNGPLTPRLDDGTCATLFFGLPRDLLSWTGCGDGPWRFRRFQVGSGKRKADAEAMTAMAMAGDLMALRRASQQISEWAAEPLADLLVGKRRWIVLPDVDFSQVPISWLSHRGRFAFETLLVEGATDLATLRARRSTSLRRAVAFADPWSSTEVSPLPEARREVEDLVRLLPIVKTSFGRQATLSHLRDLAPQADLVHFAGHVQGGSSLAESVRLLLAPDDLLSEGRASLRDIAGLPLRDLQLAVLSACSSSYSKPARLAGSLGFAQAFLRAGAAESIGTLWAVDDRQQRLVMSALYQRLTRGMSASEALRDLWQSEIATGGADRATLSASAALQLLTSIGREQESPQ